MGHLVTAVNIQNLGFWSTSLSAQTWWWLLALGWSGELSPLPVSGPLPTGPFVAALEAVWLALQPPSHPRLVAERLRLAAGLSLLPVEALLGVYGPSVGVLPSVRPC